METELITPHANGAFDHEAPGGTDTDSFTYTVGDGKGGTNTATVTIDRMSCSL